MRSEVVLWESSAILKLTVAVIVASVLRRAQLPRTDSSWETGALGTVKEVSSYDLSMLIIKPRVNLISIIQ